MAFWSCIGIVAVPAVGALLLFLIWIVFNKERYYKKHPEKLEELKAKLH